MLMWSLVIIGLLGTQINYLLMPTDLDMSQFWPFQQALLLTQMLFLFLFEQKCIAVKYYIFIVVLKYKIFMLSFSNTAKLVLLFLM